jgi:hypothetical protein
MSFRTQNGAVDTHNGVSEAQNGAVDCRPVVAHSNRIDEEQDLGLGLHLSLHLSENVDPGPH